MSRVGNNPITVPEGVNVEIHADSVKVSGKLGTLSQNIDSVSVLKEENQLIINNQFGLVAMLVLIEINHLVLKMLILLITKDYWI